MSTAIMAWEKPASAKACMDHAIMDEPSPRPRHGAAVARFSIQPSCRPVSSSSSG